MSEHVVRIGVTGHIRLTRGSARPIYRAIKAELRARSRGGALHGVTCLADGADSLFARAVRDLHGTYDVVLPDPPRRRRSFRRLLGGARSVRGVAADPRPEMRYAAASAEVLDACDLLMAVWDGTDDGAWGGTAHTVARARELGKEVAVVWPRKAKRRYVGGGSMSHSSRFPVVAARTSG
jgi:hypothetical protein